MTQEQTKTLELFMPAEQLKAVKQIMRGRDGKAELTPVLERLAATIAAMPQTYEQDGKGDEAVAHLHYFFGGCDWWITEKDVEGGVDQAYGLVDLGHGPELGYISIRELCHDVHPMMNVDFYWTPKTIGEIKAKKAATV